MIDCLCRWAACRLAAPCVAALVWPVGPAQADSPAAVEPVVPLVRHYEVQLTPDVARQSLSGELTLTLPPTTLAPLVLDAGALQIDAVQAEGRAVPFERNGPKLVLALPAPTLAQDRQVQVRYRGAYQGRPAKGLHFGAELPQLYTAFSSSQWMPCLDAPAQRATLGLSLQLPAGWRMVGNGRPTGETPLPDGQRRVRWQLDLPMPSYLYGFAAGPFREVIDSQAQPELRFLAPPSFSEPELRRIFQDTRAIMAFYAERAGMPYPLPVYSQVLVSGPAAQEMAGFAVMGEGLGRRVLQDPTRNWLAVHELSHQWWGNAVTNHDWTEFWLNEGVASFLNAAWYEHHDGRERYDALLAGAQQKLDALRAAGHDKPLKFPDWDHPTGDDRSLVYDKGALAMQALRQSIGEAAFWAGLKAYTQQHWGRAVTARDLQQAMQAASKMDLGPFFSRWVYRGDASAEGMASAASAPRSPAAANAPP